MEILVEVPVSFTKVEIWKVIIQSLEVTNASNLSRRLMSMQKVKIFQKLMMIKFLWEDEFTVFDLMAYK